MRYHQIKLFSREFLTDPDDALDLAKYGEYEKYESSLILDILNKKSHAVDIGAHCGYYSALCLSTGASVVAFEPNPLNFALLEYNVGKFSNDSRPHATLHRTALGDEHGWTTLHLSPVNSGDDTLYPFDTYDRVALRVPCTKFDNLDFWETPDFIKMDIQGSELKCLRGMDAFLSRNLPLTMAIEFYPDALRAAGDDPVEMLHFLWGKGFKLSEIKEGKDGRLEPINTTEICEREDLRQGYVNFWATR